MNLQEVIKTLADSQKILILGPPKPTTDTICAVLATKYLLDSIGKTPRAVLPTDIPEKLNFLTKKVSSSKSLEENSDFVISISTTHAQVENVKYAIKDNSVDIIVCPQNGYFRASDVSFPASNESFDLILTFGVSSLDQLGEISRTHCDLIAKTPTIPITTASPADFGTPFHAPSSSSLCEAITQIVRSQPALAQALTPDLATILLAGIIDETESFINLQTSATALAVASQLQSAGARQSEIIEHLFKMKSLPTLKIWGRIFENIEIDPENRMVWSHAHKVDFDITHTDPTTIGTMADDLLRHINGTEVCALFVERGKDILVQIRTAKSDFPLQQAEKNLPDAQKEETKYGLDLVFDKKRISSVEHLVLEALIGIQSGTPIDAEKIKPEGIGGTLAESVEHGMHPKAPENPPFDIDTKK